MTDWIRSTVNVVAWQESLAARRSSRHVFGSCEEKMGLLGQMGFGSHETMAALEQLIADHLQLVFEEDPTTTWSRWQPASA